MSGTKKDQKPKVQQQDEDVDFLHEEFDVPTPEAAGLVTEDDKSADRLSRKANVRQLNKDELEDVPVPKADEKDWREDSDETALKPLIRNRKT